MVEWTPAAQSLLEALLQMVPETYRPLAEGAARGEAEAFALERGGEAVSIEDAVRGWIATTPEDQREGLVAVLEQLGIDPEAFADELGTAELEEGQTEE